MKKAIALVAAIVSVSAAAPQTSWANTACNGCNVFDRGWSDRQLVGSTAYIEHRLGDYQPIRISGVDRSGGRVFYYQNGVERWVSASAVYDATERDERQGNTVMVAIGWLVGCALFADNPAQCWS